MHRLSISDRTRLTAATSVRVAQLAVARYVEFNSCSIVQLFEGGYFVGGKAEAGQGGLDRQDDPGCSHQPPRATALPSPTVLARGAAILRAAGDPARLGLLAQLLAGERCVSELAAVSGDSLSTVSQRLRVLRSEGLVTRRREGKHIHYSLEDGHVAELIRGVIDHAGEPRQPGSEE